MIEAFEIGVSLALRDGVSDGLAQARRDVQALENAVRGGGISVQSLRDAAGRAVGAPVLSRVTEVAQKPVPQDAGETFPRVQAGPAVQGIEAGLAEEKQSVDVLEMREPAAISVAAAPPADRPTVSLALQQAPAFRPESPAAASMDGDLPAALKPPSFVHQSVAGGPVPALSRGCAADVSPVAPVRSVARLEAGLTVAAPQTASNEWTPPAMPSAPWYAAAEMPGAEETATPSLSGAGQGLPLAGFGSTGVQAPVAQVPWLGAAGQGSAAPPAQKHEQGPHEGDVFLDGTLVGRWMSRHLNREAERASAGPTGFDAKRSRLLPGVTVGG